MSTYEATTGDPSLMNYADRLASKIETCGNPSVLGLDPRIEQMPKVVRELADARAVDKTDRIRRSIRIFHELVIDATADIVPAVKLQLAFYEQYGVHRASLMARDADRRGGLAVTVVSPTNEASEHILRSLKPFEADHCGSACLRITCGDCRVGEDIDIVSSHSRPDRLRAPILCHFAPRVRNITL